MNEAFAMMTAKASFLLKEAVNKPCRLFHLGDLEHVGAQAFVHGHGAGIDEGVAGGDVAHIFEDFGAVLDGLVGGVETVVEKALHAPEQVHGIEHAGVVAENENFGFRAEAADFESRVARNGMSDNAFGAYFLGNPAGIETNDIRVE